MGSIIEIGFKDVTSLNMRTVVDNINPLIDINSTEANSWSVLQVFIEIKRLAKSSLGFTKQSGYKVYVESGGSYYNTKDIYLVFEDGMLWLISLAYETDSTTSYGGSNQYNYPEIYNSGTYHNKDNSLKLVFDEGYTAWLGVSLLTNSACKGKMPNAGDGIYQNTDNADVKHDLEKIRLTIMAKIPNLPFPIFYRIL
jgi:hypothetical protein